MRIANSTTTPKILSLTHPPTLTHIHTSEQPTMALNYGCKNGGGATMCDCAKCRFFLVCFVVVVVVVVVPVVGEVHRPTRMMEPTSRSTAHAPSLLWEGGKTKEEKRRGGWSIHPSKSLSVHLSHIYLICIPWSTALSSTRWIGWNRSTVVPRTAVTRKQTDSSV